MNRFLILYFFVTLCACDSTDSTKPTSEKKIYAHPTIAFSKFKDSLVIMVPKHEFQRIDLLLGIDSANIVGGHNSKFYFEKIKASCRLKIDSTMFFNDKIDGAFKCWDSVNDIYRYWPFYDLYRH